MKKLLTLILCLIGTQLNSQTLIGYGANYNLITNSITSAGIYFKTNNPASGSQLHLIRILWNNQPRPQGSNSLYWDGKDDNGNIVDYSNNIFAKIISHNVKYVWEGVLANSSSDNNGPFKHRSSFFINDMKFAGTNGILTVGYNELQKSLYTINPTNYQSRHPLIEYEDYRRNFAICDTDGELAYFANIGGAEPVNFVFAANLSNVIERRWSFGTNGLNYDPWTSVIDVGNSFITGLAVQKNGNYLFVSHQNENLIKVFHKKTGAFVKQFNVPSPNRLAVKDDNLWVMNTNGFIYRYNNLSNNPVQSLTTPTLSHPQAIGVSPVNGNIVVVDGGINNQVKYHDSNGNLLWVNGQSDGVFVNLNSVNDKFLFLGSSVAFMQNGDFWVGDNGNSRMLLFDINKNHKDSIQYLPHVYCSTVDLNNPTRVFANWMEFNVDYSKPINESWRFVKNWHDLFPPIIRAHTRGFTQVSTLPNGRTYALLSGVDANSFNESVVFELLSNGTVRECYRMQTDWHTLQPDNSLRLFWFAENGYLPIYKKNFLGFDANNNPIWGANNLIASIPVSNNDDPWPRGFTGSVNPRFNISSSGLIMSFVTVRGNKWHLGAVKTNGNEFVWKTMPEQAWQVDTNGWVINPRGTFDPNPDVSYAGNQSMTIDRNIILGYHGEFWGGGQANQWLHFYDNGLFVGQFGKPLFPNSNSDGAQSETAGNAFSPTLIKHNGNLYLYHNDESAHAGIHRWRIDGHDKIQETILSLFSFGYVSTNIMTTNIVTNIVTNITTNTPPKTKGKSKNK